MPPIVAPAISPALFDFCCGAAGPVETGAVDVEAALALGDDEVPDVVPDEEEVVVGAVEVYVFVARAALVVKVACQLDSQLNMWSGDWSPVDL